MLSKFSIKQKLIAIMRFNEKRTVERKIKNFQKTNN